jgi:2-polyprenyl-6-methoxyphenol hydroxylase-like FAD-dependent oxidoreductase
MGRIVVCGGGVVGLSVASMLADDGHEVDVLEGDAAPPPAHPAQAWEEWARAGVSQFRQPHNVLPRARLVLDEELPGLTDRLLAVGCVPVDYLESFPPGVSDRSPRPGDETLRSVTGRRPVVESVIAAAAEERPGVRIRRGERVDGVLVGAATVPGVPHVVGVRTRGGTEIRADLVVDATGRRASSRQWLRSISAPPAEEHEQDLGFAYYTRFFTGPRRPRRIGPVLTPLGSMSLLTLDGDNDTWSVTVFALSGDRPLKALRDARTFDRVVAACPLQAHWLDGTPISDVLPMAGVLDRHRRLVVDGRPVVTGLVLVGDAWACTNPSLGRGLSLGLVHAQALRRTVRDHLSGPATLAVEWDRATAGTVEPYHRATLAGDRARAAEMHAVARGEPVPPADPAAARFGAAAGADPDVFRALIRIVSCTGLPQDELARPAVRAKIEAADPVVPDLPGPDRWALLELLAT